MNFERGQKTKQTRIIPVLGSIFLEPFKYSIMKRLFLLLTFSFCLFTFTQAQEFPDFEITEPNQGTGTFSNAVLPNFTWAVTGTINGETEILDDEVFDDGNEFENTFGQANFAENLRIQINPNGVGTIGQEVLSGSKLTINFNETTPSVGWGFCVVDIDVENCLISAIDENDNEVSVEEIDDWLIELFDADLFTDGLNLPKWDATSAALLGSGTAVDYLVYNNLVIGGLPDNEASAAFFVPNIPLKALIIDVENLQDDAFVSHHFYIASQSVTGLNEIEEEDFSVYPNPCMDNFVVSASQLLIETGWIEVCDLSGRKLIEQNIPSGNKTSEINVSSLPSGVYSVKFQTEDVSVMRKIIIR